MRRKRPASDQVAGSGTVTTSTRKKCGLGSKGRKYFPNN
jgi:hypothetical protein